MRLWLEGSDESIGATARHPFYSEDRCAWVGAGELVEGERVRTLGGACRVERIERVEEAARVYNVEVHGTHTYYVGGPRALVHNACNLSIRYSSRLTKSDLYHRFPTSFDSQVLKVGRVSKIDGDYVQWIHEGWINGVRGHFQVGGIVNRARSGIEITHRMFKAFQ